MVRFTSTGRRIPDNINVVYGDLTDYHSVVNAVKACRPEIVIHLGALTPVSESFRMPIAYMSTNLEGTMHLCEALRKHAYESLRLFVFAGTTEMFDTREPIRPGTPFSPTSPYAVSKISAVMYLKYMLKTYGFPYVVVIPTNTYGRAFVMQKHFVIEKIITSMIEGKKKIVMGNPDAERDFMFREDHVDAYRAVIKACVDGGMWDKVIGREFTFGTGVAWRIKDVFLLIANLLGWVGDVVWGIYRRPNEPGRIVVDYSEARDVLGWEPKYDLRSGLIQAAEEWRRVLWR